MARRRSDGGTQYGYFSENGEEYVVSRPDTPRPWYNRFGNNEYSLVISQTGGGYSVAGEKPRYLLTWYVPRYDEAGRYLYLRDESGSFWNAGFAPSRRSLDRFECRHGLGWSTFVSEANGIACEMTVFVPLSGPVEIWKISLRNTGRSARRITAFPFVEWTMDMDAQSVDDLVYAAVSNAEYDASTRSVVPYRRESGKFRYHRAFMTMDVKPDSWDANRAAFVGPCGTLADPLAVRKGRCSGTPAYAEICVGAFSREVRLRPGEDATFHVLIGLARTRGERACLKRRFLATGAPEREFGRVVRFWRGWPDRMKIETPDPEFDRYVNKWLVKHVYVQGATHVVRSIRIGYRNYAQDVLGMIYLKPARARELLVEAARYHFQSGEASPGWAANEAGARPPRHVDVKTWFVLSVCAYIRETGDLGILKEAVPDLDSARPVSILEKMRRVLRKCWKDRGQRGLCLVGQGDWNDNLNAMGKAGRGVSVWMTEAVCLIYREAAALFDVLGDKPGAGLWRKRARTLADAINRGAWDGDWYLLGYTDDGAPVGSRKNPEVKIFLLPQAWAVLSGVATPERQRRLFCAVDTRLASPYGRLLMNRPFGKPDPAIGSLTFLAKGMSENGPAYSHGSSFKVCADGAAGRGDALYADLLRCLPFRHDPSVTLAEPFVISNLYRSKDVPRKHGATHRSWTTSTPNWILKTIVEGMMGVRADYGGIRVSPAVPRKWKRCSARRVIRGAAYDVTILNPDGVENGVREIRVDGKPIRGKVVPYFSDGKVHSIRVTLGRRACVRP